MNVTEKFVHDQKDNTDKHERWKLTKKAAEAAVAVNNKQQK